jgi:hypothetical protein
MLAPGRGDRGATPGAGHAAGASAFVVTYRQAVTLADRPMTARTMTAAPVTATAVAHRPGSATTVAATTVTTVTTTTGSATTTASTTAFGECRNA